MTQEKIPSFIVAKKGKVDETLLKNTIKKCSYKKLDYYAQYKIEEEVLELDYPEDSKRAIDLAHTWDRPSIFHLHFERPERFNNNDKAMSYDIVVTFIRAQDAIRQTAQRVTAQWVMDITLYRHVQDDEKISLLNPESDQTDREVVYNYADKALGEVLYKLLNRDKVLVQTRGERTRLQLLQDKPAIITISLSKPERVHEHCQATEPGLSGIHMPLHHCKGHWRHLKNGKIIWVREHDRGDPNVARRTTVRIVP